MTFDFATALKFPQGNVSHTKIEVDCFVAMALSILKDNAKHPSHFVVTAFTHNYALIYCTVGFDPS